MLPDVTRCDAGRVLKSIRGRLDRYWPGRVRHQLEVSAPCTLATPDEVLEGVVLLLVSRALEAADDTVIVLSAAIVPPQPSTRPGVRRAWLRLNIASAPDEVRGVTFTRDVVPVGLVEAFGGFVRFDETDGARMEVWLPAEGRPQPPAPRSARARRLNTSRKRPPSVVPPPSSER